MDSVSAVQCPPATGRLAYGPQSAKAAAVQPRVVLSFRRVNGRWDKARFTAEPTNCGVVPFGYNDAPSGGRPPPTSGDGGTEAKA